MLEQEQLGRRTEEAGAVRLEFERRLHAPVERVWSALVDPDRLAVWMLADAVNLEPLRTLVIRFRNGFQSGGAITEWDPPGALAFEWGDASTVRFTLEPDPEGTLLRLVHSGLPLPEAPGTLTGWHAHLLALEAYLAGRPFAYEAAFDQLAPRYGARPHHEYMT